MRRTRTFISGFSVPLLLLLLLLSLRISGVLLWSWWWITAPIWIPFLLVLPLLLIFSLVGMYSRKQFEDHYVTM